MLGSPKFKLGDKVKFCSQQNTIVGIVVIVDTYGTWDVTEEPAYDIFVKNKASSGLCLHKHVAEKYVTLLADGEAAEELMCVEAELQRWKSK